MKRSLIIISLLLGVIGNAALRNRSVTLMWDYAPENRTPDMVFYLYRSITLR